MFAKAFLGLLLITSAQASFSNYQLVESIVRSCVPSNYICPRPQYGEFEGHNWQWDIQAIEDSPEAEMFRRARIWNLDTLHEMREVYCCMTGPCLLRCGILRRVEIDLIKAFPDNTMEIFDLNIPQIEQHRDFIVKYISKPHSESEGLPPAELEEFFDDVHKYQDLIRLKMHARELLRRAEETL